MYWRCYFPGMAAEVALPLCCSLGMEADVLPFTVRLVRPPPLPYLFAALTVRLLRFFVSLGRCWVGRCRIVGLVGLIQSVSRLNRQLVGAGKADEAHEYQKLLVVNIFYKKMTIENMNNKKHNKYLQLQCVSL